MVLAQRSGGALQWALAWGSLWWQGLAEAEGGVGNWDSMASLPQTKVFGRDRVKFMESLVVGDIAELKPDQV